MLKIREGYVLRNIIDEYIVMPVGAEMNSFSNLLVLNESSAFLWNCLQAGVENVRSLAEKLTEEYDVTLAVALQDAEEFVQQLDKLNLLCK